MDEAVAWRDWLSRAIAGDPSQLQLMYGIGGEHGLTELELLGCRATKARSRYASAMPQASSSSSTSSAKCWRCSTAHSSSGCPRETRRARRESRSPTRSSASSACGASRTRGSGRSAASGSTSPTPRSPPGPRSIARSSTPRRQEDAPLDRWRAARDEIHAEVLARLRRRAHTFVQYYGGNGLDASLLLIPISGFLPADDPRVLGTIDAIQQEICEGPFVWRYSTEDGVDGLAGGEGHFSSAASGW